MVNATSFQCDCPPDTNPPHCSTIIDPCLSNPCMNGGTCTKIVFGRNYRCVCAPNFIGRNCQRAAQVCGGVLKSESGILKYPTEDSLSYQHNARCAWLLRTNTSKVLNITFTKFNIEDSSECRFDWLQIHDGRSSASHLIGRFCGTVFPKGGNIISTQNALYFWFRSDNTTSHGGFEFSWESIDPICGGVFETTSHGSISSPGAPGKYPPNRDCEWIIRAPPGKRIQFLFFTMQIEAHTTCQYDYLEIYGGDTKDLLLEKFCNTTHPKPLLTPSNEALLYFHSDGDSNDAGFQITYSVVEGIPGCGGTYTQNSGEIKSPSQHVDGTYPHNLMCEFLIQLPANSKIQIKFLKFDLEESDDCYFDFLEVGFDELDLFEQIFI
jgi:cubilin